MLSRDEVVVTLLLAVGLYFPCSIGGESSPLLIFITFAILLGLLAFLVWHHGTRPGALASVSLPIVIIMTACTLSAHGFRLGWGVFAEFSLLALIFSLDLTQVRLGQFARMCFLIANAVIVACGIAIVAGNEWTGQLVTSSYSQFYPELVPTMVNLHKPVATFGTHSLAGFFLYLLFWLNWETYKSRNSKVSLVLALAQLILLLAVSSFTSLAFAALGLLQISIWLWKRSRRILVAGAMCIAIVAALGLRAFENESDTLANLPALTEASPSGDINGPLARYGPEGSLRATIKYLLDHPFSPIGFATPSYIYIVDSGPLEYLLRGSIPLLFLIYFGLSRFLRYNLPSASHALTLFLVIVAFETGFTALSYYRTPFLLAFSVVYLRQILPEAVPLKVAVQI